MAEHTKNAIKTSFIKLLDELPLSKITVRSIVEDCGINRNSFYYYFEDIPSLLMEITQEELDRIIAEHPSVEDLEEGLDAAISFAQKHRRAAMHIYNSVNRDIYERYIWQICDYVVRSYLDTAFPGRNISQEDEVIIKEYFKSLCFGLLANWMENGMKGDIQTSFHRLNKLTQGQTEEMLRRSREEK